MTSPSGREISFKSGSSRSKTSLLNAAKMLLSSGIILFSIVHNYPAKQTRKIITRSHYFS